MLMDDAGAARSIASISGPGIVGNITREASCPMVRRCVTRGSVRDHVSMRVILPVASRIESSAMRHVASMTIMRSPPNVYMPTGAGLDRTGAVSVSSVSHGRRPMHVRIPASSMAYSPTTLRSLATRTIDVTAIVSTLLVHMMMQPASISDGHVSRLSCMHTTIQHVAHRITDARASTHRGRRAARCDMICV